MILGYIRVSTEKQDVNNQRFEVLDYANKNNMHVDEWISLEIGSTKTFKQRRITELIHKLKEGDTLIVSELSRLGRSVPDIFTLVGILVEQNHVRLITIKERLDISYPLDIIGTALISAISLSNAIEKQLISQRTKSAYNRAKAESRAWGRKHGSTNENMELDILAPVIHEKYTKGMSLRSIALDLEIPYSKLRYYVATRWGAKNTTIKTKSPIYLKERATS